jgi:ribosome-associated protein
MFAPMTEQRPPESRSARISTEYIELDKVLKRENLVASGGEARFQITQGQARVNGEVETRKRRKCRPGDLIEFGGVRLWVEREE